MLKVNNKNTRIRCELLSKLRPCSSVSIVTFEQVNASWIRITHELVLSFSYWFLASKTA